MSDSNNTVSITIHPDGRMVFVWDDAVGVVARELGALTIRRASHVEPTPDSRWTADLSPVGGPCLGPFMNHGEAIAAERAWLETHPEHLVLQGD